MWAFELILLGAGRLCGLCTEHWVFPSGGLLRGLVPRLFYSVSAPWPGLTSSARRRFRRFELWLGRRFVARRSVSLLSIRGAL